MNRRKALRMRSPRSSETSSLIKEYEETIRNYDQALVIDPLQPNVLIQEAQALNARGIYYANIELSQQSLAGNDLERARKDFRAAATLSAKAVGLLSAKTVPTDEAGLARFNASKLEALHTRATSTRLLAQFGDSTQLMVAEGAYEEYIAAETNTMKKLRSRQELARMFLDLNSLERAEIQYEKILFENPNDPTSLLGVVMSLHRLSKLKADQGDAKAAKADSDAALQYLDQYLKVAPRGILLDRAAAMTLNEMNNRRREATRTRMARP